MQTSGGSFSELKTGWARDAHERNRHHRRRRVGDGLSIVAGRNGAHRVRLWAHEAEVRESINARHVNELFLPGQSIPESVSATNDLAEAVRDAEIVVSVMPSHLLRATVTERCVPVEAGHAVRECDQGPRSGSLSAISEVIAHGLGDTRIGALSGPSFAKEVARGDPTAIVIASRDAGAGTGLCSGNSAIRDSGLHERRSDWCRTRRRIEERDRNRRGYERRPGLGHNSVAALITRGWRR